jgi:anaerobic magnesium-protoporphyrin IX monomethyl ester cyclase
VMPAWHPEDVFSKEFADSQLTLWHPTGLMYVAAALQQAGNEVKLVDGAFNTREEIKRVIREFQPGFVGLYSNIPLWDKTRNTIEDAKEIDPSIVTGIGGPTAIGYRDKLYEKTHALDLIFTGEGEYAAPRAVNCIETGRDLAGVESLIYRKNGETIINPAGTPIKDLDRDHNQFQGLHQPVYLLFPHV